MVRCQCLPLWSSSMAQFPPGGFTLLCLRTGSAGRGTNKPPSQSRATFFSTPSCLHLLSICSGFRVLHLKRRLPGPVEAPGARKIGEEWGGGHCLSGSLKPLHTPGPGGQEADLLLEEQIMWDSAGPYLSHGRGKGTFINAKCLPMSPALSLTSTWT